MELRKNVSAVKSQESRVRSRKLIVISLIAFFIVSLVPVISYAADPVTAHLNIKAGNRTIYDKNIIVPETTEFKDSAGTTHTLNKATVLSAVIAASKESGFNLKITYYSDWNAFLIEKIANVESTKNGGWVYTLNDTEVWVSADQQEVINSDAIDFNYFVWGSPVKISSNKIRSSADLANRALLRSQSIKGYIQNPSTSAWAAMAFSAAGRNPETVKSRRSKKSRNLVQYLSTYSPDLTTDYARHILAVVASGKNPYNFKRRNLVKELKAKYSNGQFGNENLLNDDIFSVLALLSTREKVYETRIKSTLITIMNNQNTDGGFSDSTAGNSNVDMTAAAIEALSCARKKQSSLDLNEPIADAVRYLKISQNQDGGFPYTPNGLYSTSNVASTSWAIQAIYSAGHEAENIKALDSSTPFNYLLNVQRSDGYFGWQTKTDKPLPLMTSYALMALCKKPLPIYLRKGR